MTDEAVIYRSATYLQTARAKIERIGGDPEAFVRSLVRRLEALRRAGIVGHIDADRWKIPDDIAERGMAHVARDQGKDFAVRTLSTLKLERQIGSDGATWLGRELASGSRTELAQRGFGREVHDSLVTVRHAVRQSDGSRTSKDFVANLERAEIARVGGQMTAARGLSFTTAGTGDYVSGKLVGATQLASGRFRHG